MKDKLIALTFDDGPNDTTMPEIISLLCTYNAKATFFVVGKNMTADAESVVKQAVSLGFEIGNHSLTHSAMTGMTEDEILREIGTVQSQIKMLTGREPTLFRPPYMATNSFLQQTIHMPFIGGYGNYDWDNSCSVQQRIDLALEHAFDGSILLMHCFSGNEQTVAALKIILPELQRRGFLLVTVSDLFRRKNVSPSDGTLYNSVKPHLAFGYSLQSRR